jgi:hypothetical protein
MEEKKTVNRYFNSPKTPDDKAALQSLFSGQDLSLAILLASFFRYYAYEFDYKRYVVSMHSTSSRGLVEREVKAELDGWRNYSAALTIEDPLNPLRYCARLAWWILPPYSTRICCRLLQNCRRCIRAFRSLEQGRFA